MRASVLANQPTPACCTRASWVREPPYNNVKPNDDHAVGLQRKKNPRHYIEHARVRTHARHTHTHTHTHKTTHHNVHTATHHSTTHTHTTRAQYSTAVHKTTHAVHDSIQLNSPYYTMPRQHMNTTVTQHTHARTQTQRMLTVHNSTHHNPPRQSINTTHSTVHTTTQ